MISETPIKFTPDLKKIIEKIPKTDIHVHLDGCVRLETMIEIAQKEKIDLPSYTVEGLNELVFKDDYENLVEYLKTFGYSNAVMPQLPDLEEQQAGKYPGRKEQGFRRPAGGDQPPEKTSCLNS